MKEVKGYTPGPWKLCHHLQSKEKDQSCSCGYRGGIWGSDEEHIVCEIGGDSDSPRYNRDTELANAQLIAAAPVLYEENIKLKELLSLSYTTLLMYGGTEIPETTIERIKAAVTF